MKGKLIQLTTEELNALEVLMVKNRDSATLQNKTGIGYINSLNLLNRLRTANEEEAVIFTLKRSGESVGVILASNSDVLREKLKKAILVEVDGEVDGQFALRGDIDTLDWGETADLTVDYVQDGCLVTDGEFTLTKTIYY